MRSARYMLASTLVFLLASACSQEGEAPANEQVAADANLAVPASSNSHDEAEGGQSEALEPMAEGDRATPTAEPSEAAAATSDAPARADSRSAPNAKADPAQSSSATPSEETVDPHSGHDMDNMSNMSHEI